MTWMWKSAFFALIIAVFIQLFTEDEKPSQQERKTRAPTQPLPSPYSSAPTSLRYELKDPPFFSKRSIVTNTDGKIETKTLFYHGQPSIVTHYENLLSSPTSSSYAAVSSTGTPKVPSHTEGLHGHCINLKQTSFFTLFVSEDLEITSDGKSQVVDGRVGTGSSAKITGTFNIGFTNLSSSCSEISFVAAGDISEWSSGSSRGSIVVGKPSMRVSGSVLANGCNLSFFAGYFDFKSAISHLLDLSKEISVYNQTLRDVVINGTNLELVLSRKYTFEVATIGALGSIHDIQSIKLENYISGTVLIFNIPGSQIEVSNVDTFSLSTYPAIYNFYEAAYLSISRSKLHGHLIAPNAKINISSATIIGSLFGKSLNGSSFSVDAKSKISPFCQEASSKKNRSNAYKSAKMQQKL